MAPATYLERATPLHNDYYFLPNETLTIAHRLRISLSLSFSVFVIQFSISRKLIDNYTVSNDSIECYQIGRKEVESGFTLLVTSLINISTFFDY